MNGGGLFETGAGGSARPSTCSSSWPRITCAGTAGRIPRPRRLLRTPGQRDRQRARAGVGRRRWTRPTRSSSTTTVARPQAGHHRQPRQPLLHRAVLAALAAQAQDAELAARFAPLARALAEDEAKIVAELLAAGQTGRHRRLPPAGSGEALRRDAPERDAQRRAGEAQPEAPKTHPAGPVRRCRGLRQVQRVQEVVDLHGEVAWRAQLRALISPRRIRSDRRSRARPATWPCPRRHWPARRNRRWLAQTSSIGTGARSVAGSATRRAQSCWSLPKASSYRPKCCFCMMSTTLYAPLSSTTVPSHGPAPALLAMEGRGQQRHQVRAGGMAHHHETRRIAAQERALSWAMASAFGDVPRLADRGHVRNQAVTDRDDDVALGQPVLDLCC